MILKVWTNLNTLVPLPLRSCRPGSDFFLICFSKLLMVDWRAHLFTSARGDVAS
eukprot:SAG31_NODE_35418_length_323_cov_0.915179_1_plen_53_part_01